MSFDMNKYSGAGTEHLDESASMPLLKILQSLSPELNKQKDEYIPGAEVGDILYAPTQEVFKQPLTFVPVAIRTVYAEWKPRDAGGGLIAIHPLSIVSHPDYEQGRKGQYDEWLGSNELKKTTYILILFKKDEEWIHGMLALSNTGQRIARKFQQDIRKFRYTDERSAIVPAIFARTYTLASVYEENAKKEGYYNWKIDNPVVLDFEADEAILSLAVAEMETAQAALPSPGGVVAPRLTTDADDDRPY